MAKFDPHRNEETYKKWRYEKGAPFDGVSSKNRELLLQYLDDMEIGANVSPVVKRGSRSYIRLRNLKSKIHSWAIIIQDELGIDYIPEVEQKEREFLQLIKKLRDGQIQTRKQTGEVFTGVGTLIKAFKSMWHWYQRVQRKEGITVRDITQDIDGRDEKPHFNYFTIEQLNQMCNKAKYEYRVLMMFLFDTGIRAPTEMMNVKVSDLEWSEEKKHYTLTIRPETSKTFGRRIKLLLCSAMLKEFIKIQKLKADQFIFTTHHHQVNEYLKRLGNKILGLGEFYQKRGKDGKLYNCSKNGLTMYDFRHSSACYWLPRYKSESALKYRFGWKKSEMIHYYTELLGMRDTIEEEDLYVDVSKTQLERDIANKGNEITLLQEQIQAQDRKMEQMMDVMKALQLESRYKEMEPYTVIIEKRT
ncbi:tyrosine-type recombinase/integrase [Candidatus Woesearchaeota archaeon]|nr:tyrosine-type recombinase/integrase [Candidatus Woesearchaeota archaeon]MCF7901769.1 tyrosine-type recombinase/integrase [Candidatus Woesearchaeota archaeon]MCF8013163.1 tyrosine-type recombinase/integrase [Candidatus Woesearchaeota archaeon]